ncbi:MAG: thioredoxin [Clostridiales bacterium]|nr:thioredoxin [Clostridiales bacterium]
MTRIVLAVCGAVLVVVGIFNGGMASILEKAINICTQCIGLG